MEKKSGNDLISIVVPIYNVENYLEACIKSLLNQTYKNIEIILVDDGATDRCPEICDEYAKKDDRIVIVHKANGGLSDARNAGLEIARGQYITFVDSDDLVGLHFIENLYLAIVKNEADISICDYKKINEDEKKANEINAIKTYNMDRYVCLKNMYQPKMHGMEFVAWGKLYKTVLFNDNNILYPVGKIHEDTFTTYKLIYYARRIVFIDAVGYFYRQRTGSIMSSGFSRKSLLKVEATREACEFFVSDSFLLGLALNNCLNTIISLWCSVRKKYHGHDKKELEINLEREFITSLKKYSTKSNMSFKKVVFYNVIMKLWEIKLFFVR